MFCKYCGKVIDDDSIYCSFCGKNVSSQVEEQPEERLTIEDYWSGYYLPLKNKDGDVADFELQDIIEFEGKKYIYALPAPVHTDEGYPLTDFVVFELEDEQYLGDFVLDDRYEPLAKKAQYNHNLKDPHRAKVQRSLDNSIPFLNALMNQINNNTRNEDEAMGLFNRRSRNEDQTTDNNNRIYEPFRLQIGRAVILFRFNILDTASTHDRRILVKAIGVWQGLATSSYIDYDDYLSAGEDTFKKQMEFYSLIDTLRDTELKNEMDRAYQTWLNY